VIAAHRVAVLATASALMIHRTLDAAQIDNISLPRPSVPGVSIGRPFWTPKRLPLIHRGASAISEQETGPPRHGHIFRCWG
jgi:hypothetical protein